MPDSLPYERMLRECLKGELRVVNAGLPRNQKPLSDLLHEEYPYVECADGSAHFFKKKELERLAGMVSSEEQGALLLPMLIELRPGQAEASVIYQGEVEGKVISKILNMPVTPKQGEMTIYKPQLALLRKMLKTTTQYVFSPSHLIT